MKIKYNKISIDNENTGIVFSDGRSGISSYKDSLTSNVTGSHGYRHDYSGLLKEYEIVHRIVTPLFPSVEKAYYQSQKEVTHCQLNTWKIERNQSINFDSYFNSFFISRYNHICGEENYTIFIELEGSCIFQTKSVNSEGHTSTLSNLRIQSLRRNWYAFPLPHNISKIDSYRIFFDIKVISEELSIHNFFIARKANECEASHTNIIIRTMNRSIDATRILNQIRSSDFFDPSKLTIYLYDPNKDINVSELIPSQLPLRVLNTENYGAAGNLYNVKKEIVKECQSGVNDTVIIIDDDVYFDNESLSRIIYLRNNSINHNNSFCASFLDKVDPLHVDGTVGTLKLETTPYKHIVLNPIGGGFKVNDNNFLNNQCLNYSGNIGAYYFLAVNASDFINNDPLPFHLKWDDIDFTYRISKKGANIFAMPGISIWHDAFYHSMPSWQEVLEFKNELIVTLMHHTLDFESFSVICNSKISKYILTNDYALAECMINELSTILSSKNVLFNSNTLVENADLIRRCQKIYAQQVSESLELASPVLVFRKYDNKEESLVINGEIFYFTHELHPDQTKVNSNLIKINRKASRFYLTFFDNSKSRELFQTLSVLLSSNQDFNTLLDTVQNTKKSINDGNLWNNLLNIK
jgi:hypothetical protein